MGAKLSNCLHKTFITNENKFENTQDLEKGEYVPINTEEPSKNHSQEMKKFITIDNLSIPRDHSINIDGDVHIYGDIHASCNSSFVCVNLYNDCKASCAKDRRIFQNHLEIEQSKDTDCSKLLQHYFEVINNDGEWYIYDNDATKLVEKIKFLTKTTDEHMCQFILNNIKTMTIQDVIFSCKEWRIRNPERFDSLVRYGLNTVPIWSPEVMLGELWLTYIGKLTDPVV